ncbi:NADH-quinone oxidoreductase subunit A [candidate division KSB1 bacterium]|nr:NADH-quinone oxidoreductase subunit A [candidate division KSB1 bacterium]NIR70764.1 NADH-quinone oxidoreductase subunit A [candidate division KSB1 bacterium]NIS23217.1 NADH-quinone oxidoreductase subunit A [candidate division KSB1 bacterium]NIT70077.1 NADH-quinone oxidoreductase subunit A [candidate division KSB1 bacterium]NIU23714.1 NADH-quinone oxidoreductase subunit A [candidate division KSB1 bacterium]
MNPPPIEETIDFGTASVYFIGVLVVVGVMLGLSFVLGQRHRERATGEPFESGIQTTGSARLRFSARFYLVAMLFVIFDLEAALIFGWAVAAQDLGWAGYWGMLVFVVILAAGLIYEWKVGALDWSSKSKRANHITTRQTKAKFR